MKYDEAMDYIHKVGNFGSNYGLERTYRLLEILGNPQEGLKLIHIAGTNGKGSTTSIITSLLMEKGFKVGMYTSPFLEEFEERIQINRNNIPKDTLGRLMDVLKVSVDQVILEGYNHPTEFEIITCLMLLYFIALKFKLLPVVSTGDGIEKMILPVLTLAFSMAAKYTRQVRTVVLEELNQDYVIGARARGIKENIILLRHVLPNSLLPLITLLGLSLGSLLGGTAVVEVIFSYPGLGNMAVSAITSYDYPLIQAYVMWIALIYMIINLLIDISYKYLDPRVKERG